MKLTDEEILTQIKLPESKDKAFRELLSNYQERLYYHVRRYVHNHEDANDILQNTFIKTWKGIEHFQGNSALYTWLYRIASNEAITFINKQKKRNETDITQTSVAYRGTMDAVNADSMLQKLQHAIDTLPDKQKQVFIMRYYDELPYNDIEKIVGTSVGALKASYHHAVKKIEEFLLLN
ncbi:MAG TPA: RNA polymerase sigma factor [Chitinophagales bacterium]|jgi:RNA polymerase sigma-70 factor (ECF subfamily)|nr:RNA polymerase sigma factor [Chitinophagales bacterium]HQG38141.1 RNA polymerase sigma factor [Chitinophagales bacterium]